MPGLARPKVKLRKIREIVEQPEPRENDEETEEEASPERRHRQGRRSSSGDDGRKNNAHYRMLKALAPLIERSQHKSKDLDALVDQAVEVYKETDKKIFVDVLWRMMIVPSQVKEKLENIERVMKFFHQLVGSIVRMEHNEAVAERMETDENDSTHDTSHIRRELLSHRILKFCEKYHEEGRPQVRMRTVQTIVKVCEACKTMDEIDDGLKMKIANVLLARLKDKNHNVRVEAAKGLCYFQGGQGCPVTRSMMESIRIDPRPEVRKALVLSIVLDSDDYGDFLDRVADVHPEVRRACMRQIREISLMSIPPAERERIIYCGMNDVSPGVREETVKLIRHWFRVCGEDPVQLLNEFDMYNNSKLCLKIFDIIFDEITEENWNILSKDLLVNKFLPLDGISEIKMFLWWYLFHKFSPDPFYAEKLYPVLGDAVVYCNQLIEKLETEHFDEDERQRIMGLFLKIVLFIPAEEGGRVALDRIARIAFKFKYKSLLQVKLLVLVIHKAHPNGCDEILLELVRDMMESIACDKPVNALLNQENREEKIRDLKLKLSEILHKKYGLRKEKEQLIQNNNFLEAHAVQEKLKEVEDEANAARLELQNYENEENANALETEDSPQEPQQYTWEALFYAFHAFLAHLKLVPKISHYLKNFYHAEVVNAIFREENELRTLVIQIMTQVGFFSLEDALTAMVVCLQGILNEGGDVKQVALQCIFDLVLNFGIESFEDPKVLSVFTQMEDLAEPGDDEAVANLLRQLLTSFIRSGADGKTQHIAVLGMLKLLIMGRIKSSKIVATLLTFWANSANEGTKVYHDIGTGLSAYVQQSSENAECVARALVPSVGKVISAPSNSSFRKVDPEKLMGFITMQTDQSKLKSISKPQMPHEIIAIDVLDEIRKRPMCADNVVFVKALKGLSLQGIARESLTELKGKLKHVMKDELRTVRQSLAAFGKYLDELDPEIKTMAQMSDPETASSSSEAEDHDKTDMFHSMNSTVVGRSVLSASKAAKSLRSRNATENKSGESDVDNGNEDDIDDTLVSQAVRRSKTSSLTTRRSKR